MFALLISCVDQDVQVDELLCHVVTSFLCHYFLSVQAKQLLSMQPAGAFHTVLAGVVAA